MIRTKILLLIVVIGLMPAQEADQPNQLLMNVALPSVYMQFDHTEKRPPVHPGETGKVVLLRLSNNTRGAISICTESMYVGEKVHVVKLSSGKTILAIRDGAEVAACYDIERDTNAGAARQNAKAGSGPATGYHVVRGAGGDMFSTSWVASGGWVIVGVPITDLASNCRIAIRFNYEWEPNTRDESHTVLFRSSELP